MDNQVNQISDDNEKYVKALEQGIDFYLDQMTNFYQHDGKKVALYTIFSMCYSKDYLKKMYKVREKDLDELKGRLEFGIDPIPAIALYLTRIRDHTYDFVRENSTDGSKTREEYIKLAGKIDSLYDSSISTANAYLARQTRFAK
ncbi:MAG: hypothetical protein WCQ49_00650 [Candidatus Saccharibacteria bacterium]